MTLDEYLDGCPTDEEAEAWREAANYFVAESLSRIKGNFESECRLSRATWERVFLVLVDASQDELRVEITAVFRDHKLTGPAVTGTPQPKGRALERERFTALARDAEIFASPEAVTQFIDDVRNGHLPVIPYDQRLRRCPLGNYLMWSTFKEQGGDPFASCSDADTVRTKLGLQGPKRPEDRELVLLVYDVPPEVTVRYPTIADAYAADDWNVPFQCSNPQDPWGYTVNGHPEVVHDVINGAHLASSSGNGGHPFRPLRIVD